MEDGLTLGGLTFGNWDLVKYDPVAIMTTSLFLKKRPLTAATKMSTRTTWSRFRRVSGCLAQDYLA
jgi:hypothetical protein